MCRFYGRIERPVDSATIRLSAKRFSDLGKSDICILALLETGDAESVHSGLQDVMTRFIL